jgi:hypothetical protein
MHPGACGTFVLLCRFGALVQSPLASHHNAVNPRLSSFGGPACRKESRNSSKVMEQGRSSLIDTACEILDPPRRRENETKEVGYFQNR